MKSWDELQVLTELHMNDPQPEDRFHEMYSFWVHIVGRDGDAVITRETSPCKSWEPKRYENVEQFKAAFAYGTISGYSVQYYDT